MSKSIYFFGQSVFGQLISLLDRGDIQKAVRSNNSDYKYKGFQTWEHLISMLFCTLSGCSSLREITAGFLGLKGKTEHFALKKLPRRSTLSDANRKRIPKVFEDIYNDLLRRYLACISDSRIAKQFGHKVFLIDSTTITLFCAIMRGAGRIPKTGKQKGGIKVHTMLNPDEQVPRLIWMSPSATNDIQFFHKIDFEKNAVYVFDKGYVDYERYEEFCNRGVYFVTRLREKASYQSLQDLDISDDIDPGVIKDELIELPIRKNGKVIRTIKLRRVVYWNDSDEKYFVFLTNLEVLAPDQIALLYKQRWAIELLFKQVKQNFPLKYFLGDNTNAIEIQVWCVLIANLLMTVVKSRVKKNWAFSNIATFCRIHLFNHIHLIRFLQDPEKDWETELNKAHFSLFSG
jgi:Transposase DDE domain/Domain of unknown function (DUF4372)